jgi:hypothetical protein
MTQAPDRVWFNAWDRLPRMNDDGMSVEYIRADLVPQWQPIETAPKDGTHILALWVPYNLPRWVRETIMFMGGGWVSTWSHDPIVLPRGAVWQPLPAPPSP